MDKPLLRYDRRTIVLHWLTAILVITLWTLGHAIDGFAKGEPRIFARSVHIARVHWRSGKRAVRLPTAGSAWLGTIATLMHWLLYILLIATVVLGITNAWVRGDTIFGLFKIPAFDPGNEDLRDTVEVLHGLSAFALLVAALLHAAAALLHHFVGRDDVLRRMLPAR